MTRTELRSVSPAVKPANPVNPVVVLVAWVAGIATLIIRLALHGRSFDLFGDEVIYTDLGPQCPLRRVPPVLRAGVFPAWARVLLPGSGLGAARRASGQPDGLDLRDAYAQWAASRGHRRGPGAAGDAGQLGTGRRRGGSAFRVGAILHPAERQGPAGNRDDALGDAGIPAVHVADRPTAGAPRLAPGGRRRRPDSVARC